MNTILWTVAVLLVITGLAGIVLPMLPGTVLVFSGLLIAAWADGFEKVGWVTIAVLGAFTAVSFLVDIAASGAGVKQAGASKQAVAGALIGAVAGLFFGIIGILAGPFLGAVTGEFLAHRDLFRAGKAGLGTAMGLVLGAAVKIALAFGMIGIFAAAYLS
jgi:hypothetical protein